MSSLWVSSSRSPSPFNKSIVRLLRDEWNQNPHSITQLHVCLQDAKKDITQLHVLLLDAAFIKLKHQTGFSIDILFCSDVWIVFFFFFCDIYFWFQPSATRPVTCLERLFIVYSQDKTFKYIKYFQTIAANTLPYCLAIAPARLNCFN